MTSPKIVVGGERESDEDCDCCDDDVMALQVHCNLLPAPGIALPSGFSMVVLASHSSPRCTVFRLCGAYPRALKKDSAVSLAATESFFAPRAPASFSSASTSIVAAPSPIAAGWI